MRGEEQVLTSKADWINSWPPTWAQGEPKSQLGQVWTQCAKCRRVQNYDGRVLCWTASRLLRCEYICWLLDCMHLYRFLPFHSIHLDDNKMHKATIKQESCVFICILNYIRKLLNETRTFLGLRQCLMNDWVEYMRFTVQCRLKLLWNLE